MTVNTFAGLSCSCTTVTVYDTTTCNRALYGFLSKFTIVVQSSLGVFISCRTTVDPLCGYTTSKCVHNKTNEREKRDTDIIAH